MTADLKDLQSENAYLKDALKIYSPIEEAKVDDIKFNVTECIGSKSKQEVAVTIVLINEEANNYYQMGRSNLIDPQGETHKSYRASFDDNKMGTTLTTDVPTRAQLVFKNVLPKITIIKSLQLINNSGYVVVEFKDIPITWE